jgi:hypothetical protein
MPSVRVSHCRPPRPVVPVVGEVEEAVMNSEEFLKFQAEQYQFASQQIELYSRYLKKDSRAGHLKYDAEKANSLALQARLDAIQSRTRRFLR